MSGFRGSKATSAAPVFVLVEHLLKRPAAVGRSENAPFFVWAAWMTQRRDKEPVRLRGSMMICGSAARREGRSASRSCRRRPSGRCRRPWRGQGVDFLAAAYIDDVRIGRRDRDRADRTRRLIVEDRHPGSAVVGRLPHAAVVEADEEGIRTIGDADCGLPASRGGDRSCASASRSGLSSGSWGQRARSEDPP